jgi:hypothetical protein
MYSAHDSNKVRSVLEHLHNKTTDDDEDEDTNTNTNTNTNQNINTNSNTFLPPPPPQSSGVERRKFTENMQNNGLDLNLGSENGLNTAKLLGKAPNPNIDEKNYELNNYQSNYHNGKSMDEYYKKMLPEYSSQKNRYYSNPSSLSSSMDMNMNQDLFVQKLNYMIHLLEEQQDEKTNNVTEEVVLYSFLGIFIIFLVDSFTRIGKYVR